MKYKGGSVYVKMKYKGGLFILQGNTKGGIFFIVLKKVDREMIYFPVSLYSMTPFPVSLPG